MSWYRHETRMTELSRWQRIMLASQILRGWTFTVAVNIYTDDVLILDGTELILEKEER